MTEMTTRTNGMFANGSLAARPASAAATIPNPEGAFVMCWRVLAGLGKGGQISNVDGERVTASGERENRRFDKDPTTSDPDLGRSRGDAEIAEV